MNNAGFPESDLKRYFDPKNEVTMDVVEANGVFDIKTTVTLMPEWNSTVVAKVDYWLKKYPFSILSFSWEKRRMSLLLFRTVLPSPRRMNLPLSLQCK